MKFIPMYSKNLTNNLKKPILYTTLVILIALLQITGFSQNKVFTLQNSADIRIEINSTFSGDTLLSPFKSVKAISGLAVSCDFIFNSDSSLVRITLIDEQYNEFLICESYPLLSISKNFSLLDYAEETASLNNIIPKKIKIEIIDASILLKELITSKQENLIEKSKVDILQQQNLEKIKRLNENIIRNGGIWIAGETSVSKLSYREKKQLFGDNVPNLEGFEYYSGGIFQFSGSKHMENNLEKNSNSSVVPNFDWRNRHGANKPGSPYYNNNPGSNGWITPIRIQGGCGACWIFGPVGALEAKVNLFYNQHIDLDLSEQHVMSCNGGGAGCFGASLKVTLKFAQDSGIIDESCLPYVGEITDCSNKCLNPDERIKISGFIPINGLSQDQIKTELIKKGPIAGSVYSWSHSMTLIGYSKLAEGDTVYGGDLNSGPIIIRHGNINIGQTYWIFKNSWGPGWGENGYARFIEDDLGMSCIIDNSISSLNYDSDDIRCVDLDGDGYYYWGLGSKPPQCPSCPEEPDGDDSNPCLGPMDEFGNHNFFTPIPFAKDTSILLGEAIPDLIAEGEDIAWYGNKEQTNLLFRGNSFATGKNDPGIYTYYITQTLNGCESDILPVSLTIRINPPVVQDVIVYFGEEIPDLIASGENIKWYREPLNPLYDSRDGQIYKTTLIGNQLWMAENLNYYTPTESLYYNNDSLSYAETYGRLYNWNTALNSCPVNWHLPSDEEWMELENNIGINLAEANKTGYRGIPMGGKLKETGTLHWESPNSDATNEVNFNALPAGTYSPTNNILYQFEWLGTKADFLTSSDTTGTDIIPFPHFFHRSLWYENGNIGRFVETCFENAYSVRCISYPSEQLFIGNTYKPIYKLPGKYIYYVTQTISGYESLADTVIFTILSEVRPPEVENISICEGQQVPDLTAKGSNIRWYDDPELRNILHESNTYTTGQTVAGNYTYYVTQSISNYESLPDTVTLTIKSVPAAPVTDNVKICESEPIPDLNAIGENIKWYNDTGLTDSIGSGANFETGKTLPGNYIYYVSQTISGCESVGELVELVIYRNPLINLGEDTTIYVDQSLVIGPFTNDNSYLWNDGSQNPYFAISGNNPGPGSYQVSVIVSDLNGCINSDTVIVNVVPYSSINYDHDSQQISIFPNPAKELLNIGITNLQYESILIKIYNQNGEEINDVKIYSDNLHGILQLNVSHLHSGMYYIQILTNKKQYIGKIIVL